VEYEHEERADSRFGTFDATLDWAIAEDVEELRVFSPLDRTYTVYSRDDEAALRERYGSQS
jgi:hypothetical protein